MTLYRITVRYGELKTMGTRPLLCSCDNILPGAHVIPANIRPSFFILNPSQGSKTDILTVKEASKQNTCIAFGLTSWTTQVNRKSPAEMEYGNMNASDLIGKISVISDENMYKETMHLSSRASLVCLYDRFMLFGV